MIDGGAGECLMGLTLIGPVIIAFAVLEILRIRRDRPTCLSRYEDFHKERERILAMVKRKSE